MSRVILCVAAVLLSACAPPPDGELAASRSELAPTGVLRVAIAVAPAASTFFSTRDPGTGRLRGVAVELGAALAEDLGVPVEYVVYPNSGELTDAASEEAWDVTFMPVDEERAAVVDFGPAYNLFESTFLVPPGSPIGTIAEVDRAGVRVAVIENTTTARSAARYLEAASLQIHRTVDELTEALRLGSAEAAALSRASLENLAAALPGARILDGHFHATANAVAVPKGRPAALAYVTGFIETAKASGAVRRAFDEAGLPTAVVAPPAPGP